MNTPKFQLNALKETLLLGTMPNDGDHHLMSTFQGKMGDLVITSDEPVIVLFKNCRTLEFGSIESATAWLERASLVDRTQVVAGARIYTFESGQWKAAMDLGT